MSSRNQVPSSLHGRASLEGVGVGAESTRQALLPRDASSLFAQLIFELRANFDDLIELHDKFHLSQACHASRDGFARSDWDAELGELAPSQRIDFLTGLAYTRAGFFWSETCTRIMRVDSTNAPGRCVQMMLRDPCAGSLHRTALSMPFHTIGSEYSLWQMHVQMALKLTRMNIELAYVDRLMAPREAFAKPIAKVDPDWPLYVRAVPKIVNGRFLLSMEYWFLRDQLMSDFHALGLRSICQHVHLKGHWVSRRSYCRDGRAPAGEEIREGCKHCPTDYSITGWYGMLLLRGWYDFGTETKPIWDLHTTFNAGMRDDAEVHVPGTTRGLFAGDSDIASKDLPLPPGTSRVGLHPHLSLPRLPRPQAAFRLDPREDLFGNVPEIAEEVVAVGYIHLLRLWTYAASESLVIPGNFLIPVV